MPIGRIGRPERGVDIETLSTDESIVLKLFSAGKSYADRIGREIDRPALRSVGLMLLELNAYIAKRLDGFLKPCRLSMNG